VVLVVLVILALVALVVLVVLLELVILVTLDLLVEVEEEEVVLRCRQDFLQVPVLQELLAIQGEVLVVLRGKGVGIHQVTSEILEEMVVMW